MNYFKKKRTNISILLVMTLCSLSLLGQTEQELKTITGQITYLNAPLPEVNIVLQGTNKGAKTDVNGIFNIDAKVGDELLFSHVGFNTFSVVVEDVTTVLNLEMDAHVNELDEVLISSRKDVNKVSDLYDAMNVDIQTSIGKKNPVASGYAVHYLDNDNLRMIASASLEEALNGKFSRIELRSDGFLYIRGARARYDVDGQLYESPPALIFSEIEHLYIIKEKAFIIIRTKEAPDAVQRRKEELAESYRNQNFYANDAVPFDASETTDASEGPSLTKKGEIRKITGKITYLGAPVPDVNIVVKGSSTGTKTNRRGKYTIKARVGDQIEYTHVAYKTIGILIEDITSELSIEMIENANELEEVIVSVKTINGEAVTQSAKAGEKFNTSRGEFDPKKAGFAVGYVDGDDIGVFYTSIKEALQGKIAGYSVNPTNGQAYLRGANSSLTQDYPVAWEVDGVFTTDEPRGLDISQVESVHALKSLASTTKYGTLGAGGVIVIQTKSGDYRKAQKDLTASKYTNKNYYNNDATSFDQNGASYSEHAQEFRKFTSSEAAYLYYTEVLKNAPIAYNEHIWMAKKFITQFDDLETAKIVFDNIVQTHYNHPEILKAVAFQLQAYDLNKEAKEIYERVFTLRPSYAQSYRDLANSYKENELYVKAWRLYMSYLFQGNEIIDEGIGDIIYNEMEYLYFVRKNQSQIKQQFVPRNEDVNDFKNDVRIVIEWHTSEAEFDLEFVSPDRRAYVFEHSLASNQDLITKEKEKGYSSKGFIIETVDDGEWLINLTYKGNKKPEPTYFKFTTHYNWGKWNQRDEVKVYEFEEQRNKVQLLKINKELLFAVD